MDFTNEPYVRVYTRDTTNWRRMGWDGQNVLMQLLRKVDRSGVIDLEGLEPWEVVCLHTGAPEESAKRGIESLLRIGTVEVRGSCLVIPNHLEAQEATKSDKVRAKEYREKRALGLNGTQKSSQAVTSTSQAVTPASREITGRHDGSRDVTPRHPLLCSAEALLCTASQESSAGTPAEPTAPPVVERIRELESRYPAGLANEARQACASARRNGKMANSLWLATLETLSKHPLDLVTRSVRTFVERYADGQKDERYLLGIVRGEARASTAYTGRANGNNGRPQRAAATTAKDFENEPSEEEQLARQLKEFANG